MFLLYFTSIRGRVPVGLGSLFSVTCEYACLDERVLLPLHAEDGHCMRRDLWVSNL